jgi:hypothetical protein
MSIYRIQSINLGISRVILAGMLAANLVSFVHASPLENAIHFEQSGPTPKASAIGKLDIPVDRDRYAIENISEFLGEPYTLEGASPDGSSWGSTAGFNFITAPEQGVLMIQRKAGMPADTAIRPDKTKVKGDLKFRSANWLSKFGIRKAEVGDMSVHTVMKSFKTGSSDKAEVKTDVHAYKVFIERKLNGLPVLGSRAVLTYDQNGLLKKSILNWPRLAESGHTLTSSLDKQRIIELVAKHPAIVAGAKGRETNIPVRLAYQPFEAGHGQVALKLVAEATIYAQGGKPDGKVSVHLIELN